MAPSLLPQRFFLADTRVVAQRLVGYLLLRREKDGSTTGGRIVETEAYRHDDPASHSFRGPTERNAAMFLPPGHAYVYRSYGIHWCFNVVTGPRAVGEAVLIRAIEPLWGLDLQRERRALRSEQHPHTTDPRHIDRRLSNGPGKLCQALEIDRSHDGLSLTDPASPVQILCPPTGDTPPEQIDSTARIGISRASDKPWRFTLRGSRFLSR
jgi:DNA-3-methyladenine glycosylase